MVAQSQNLHLCNCHLRKIIITSRHIVAHRRNLYRWIRNHQLHLTMCSSTLNSPYCSHCHCPSLAASNHRSADFSSTRPRSPPSLTLAEPHQNSASTLSLNHPLTRPRSRVRGDVISRRPPMGTPLPLAWPGSPRFSGSPEIPCGIPRSCRLCSA